MEKIGNEYFYLRIVVIMKRRNVIKGALVMGTAIATSGVNAAELRKGQRRPKVLFFDSNETMLDLKGMGPAVTKAFGGRDDLMSLWFTTMLQYSLVDTVTSNYHDFGTIGMACMLMVAQGHGIELSKKKAQDAIMALRSIPAHRDVPPGLKIMRESGFRMYTLTNSPPDVVKAQLKNAGIRKYFDGALTIDGLNVYKPHTRTYHWAAHQAKVPIQDCMMIAAHGWDVAGARLAGMRAAFIERPGKAIYPLGPDVEMSEPDMKKIAERLVAMSPDAEKA
jgi:2-haloacid dehalogenase